MFAIKQRFLMNTGILKQVAAPASLDISALPVEILVLLLLRLVQH